MHIYLTVIVVNGRINNISTYIYLTHLTKSHGQVNNISIHTYLTLLIRHMHGQVYNIYTCSSTQHVLLRPMVKSIFIYLTILVLFYLKS